MSIIILDIIYCLINLNKVLSTKIYIITDEINHPLNINNHHFQFYRVSPFIFILKKHFVFLYNLTIQTLHFIIIFIYTMCWNK